MTTVASTLSSLFERDVASLLLNRFSGILPEFANSDNIQPDEIFAG